jgi:hypothetical protein
MKTLRPLLLVLAASLMVGRAEARDHRIGLWVSEGYGLFFRIEPAAIKASEITSRSCLPAWTALRSKDKGAAWVFRGGFASGDERIRISLGKTADTAILRRSDDLAAMKLRRIASPPPACVQAVVNTPTANYDVLWKTFAENYPFFKLHNVDWNATDRRMRPRVTATTTPDELFSVFREMLEPLRDSHIVLDVFPQGDTRGKDWLKTPLKEIWVHKDDQEPLDDADLERANRIIETKYIHGKTEKFCGGQIRFGHIAGGQLGYLGVLSFHQYTPDDDLPAGLACIRAASDKIFAGTTNLKGLIIDVRTNGGGEDAFVLELASRFTNRKYLAFGKQALVDSADRLKFTDPESIYIEPSRGPKYLGPTVLLTGRHSASAAETFTMALMGRQPKIVRIGENTQGVFSDVLDRRLPNGWRLVLPNEIYVTEDGKSFDVLGVSPDVRTPGLSRNNFDGEKDPGLQQAVAILLQH